MTGEAAEGGVRPELAAAVRERDPETLREIIEENLPRILRAARRAGLSPQDAEDVTQETFATFLRIAPRFEGRSRVRTFLFGILYRKLVEARRDLARHREHDPIDNVVEKRFAADGRWARPPADADSLVRRAEIRRFLLECLETSPAVQRLAFHMQEVEGMPRREIRNVLNVTANNLNVMLHRLRNRTRECLEKKTVRSAS